MKIELKRYEDVGPGVQREILELRNSDRIRLVSLNQSVISLDDHLRWIESLRGRRDVAYYAVFRDGELAGSLSLTHIDRDEGRLEWGVWFREDVSLLPALVIYEMLERVFFGMGFSTVELAVQPDNATAIGTNRGFGFRESGTRMVGEREYREMMLTKEEWERLRGGPQFRALRRLGESMELIWN